MVRKTVILLVNYQVVLFVSHHSRQLSTTLGLPPVFSSTLIKAVIGTPMGFHSRIGKEVRRGRLDEGWMRVIDVREGEGRIGHP